VFLSNKSPDQLGPEHVRTFLCTYSTNAGLRGNDSGRPIGAEGRLFKDTEAEPVDQEVIGSKVRRKLPTQSGDWMSSA
jgi:hypothetical protein